MKTRIKQALECGVVKAISSKSQAHRLVIAGALSEAKNLIFADTASVDIGATKECMARLMESVRGDSDDTVTLNAHESGSTLRFLVPVAAALGKNCDFIMEGRLPERPMGPLLSQLSMHGVEWTRPSESVLRISGKLGGGIFELPGNLSSQYVTGLLMALPLIGENSEIRILGELQSRPYVDMTLSVLKRSGIQVFEDSPGDFYVPGGQRYGLSGDIRVEGDWSNAAFWFACGAINGKGITVKGLDPRSSQGDKAILDILKEMGAEVSWEGDSVTVRGGNLRGTLIDCRNIPDLVPAIMIAACSASGKTMITNAERLRIKESDRIESILNTLRSLGVLAEERPDGMVIYGSGGLHGGTVSSFNDHRIAMMAACLRALTPEGPEGDIILEGAEAVSKSYPGFWDDYQTMGGMIEEI